jgi:hypothetical protein
MVSRHADLQSRGVAKKGSVGDRGAGQLHRPSWYRKIFDSGIVVEESRDTATEYHLRRDRRIQSATICIFLPEEVVVRSPLSLREVIIKSLHFSSVKGSLVLLGISLVLLGSVSYSLVQFGPVGISLVQFGPVEFYRSCCILFGYVWSC